MSSKDDLVNEALWAQRSNYKSYVTQITTLSTASLGFCVLQTMDRTLSLTLIPLGICVISFGVSIVVGLYYVRYILKVIRIDLETRMISRDFEWFKEDIPNYKTYEPEKLESIKIEIDVKENRIKEIVESSIRDGRRANVIVKLQHWCFYSGILFFLIWRVWEMYCNT